MTDKGAGDASERKEQLRLEASAWFARMRRDDAERFRSEFDAWLAEPEHLAAYNRIAERFSNAKLLRSHTTVTRADEPMGRRSWRRLLVLGAGLALLLLTCAALPILVSTSQPKLAETGAISKPTQLATLRGEIRSVHLVDGSKVTLDTDTLLTVSFGKAVRRLRLDRGRARFEVAHETRPFVVAAGDGSVTAHGTIFDVAVDNDQFVRVALLEGAVDVALPTKAPDNVESGAMRRLRPGDEIAFEHSAFKLAPAVLLRQEASWPQAMIDFDEAPLTEIIARANRYSPTRIELGDASLASLKASGRFRINDPERLADNLARVFDLRVDRDTPGEIILRPCRGFERLPCGA